MNIADVLKPKNINLTMNCTSKEAALSELCGILYKNEYITDKNKFLNDVLNREKISSTAIGNFTAIPHGKSTCVKETVVAVGRLKKSVCWEGADNNEVKVIILLAVNDDDKNTKHVKLLSRIARCLVSEEICKALCEAETPERVIELLT